MTEYNEPTENGSNCCKGGGAATGLLTVDEAKAALADAKAGTLTFDCAVAKAADALKEAAATRDPETATKCLGLASEWRALAQLVLHASSSR